MEGIYPVFTCAFLVFIASFCLVTWRVQHLRGAALMLMVKKRLERFLSKLAQQRVFRWCMNIKAWKELAAFGAQKLRHAEINLDIEQTGALFCVAYAGFSVLLAALCRSIFILIFCAGFLCVIVPLSVRSLERKRMRLLAQEMPDVFRVLALSMGSGETLTQALRYVALHQSGEIGHAFQQAVFRLNCGMSSHHALECLSQELQAPGVELLVTALHISQRTGSPLQSLFQRSARMVERQSEFERLLSVKTAQVRTSVKVVSILPILLVLTLSFLSPDFRLGIQQPAGMMCLVVAALLDGIALIIMRKIMKAVRL